MYVEQMSYSGLQRRAKETTYDDKGRAKKKKRFGKSLANKAPALFLLDFESETVLFGTDRIETCGYKSIPGESVRSYRSKLPFEKTGRTLDGSFGWNQSPEGYVFRVFADEQQC